MYELRRENGERKGVMGMIDILETVIIALACPLVLPLYQKAEKERKGKNDMSVL